MGASSRAVSARASLRGSHVINPLELNEAELDALRGLQIGMNRVGADDPVWEELEVLGLVDTRTALVPQLTPLGRRYRTD
jgi:hypothetical protein